MNCYFCGQEINMGHKFVALPDGECSHTSCYHAEVYGDIVDLDRGCLVKAGGILIPVRKEGDDFVVVEDIGDNVVPLRR